MDSITLRKIDESNFLDCFGLKLAAGQEKYVSNPIRSLAQAYVYYSQCVPFGIYAADKMVGYVMVIYDYDEEAYNIWHMMIDSAFQGNGYGKGRCGKFSSTLLRRRLEAQKPFCSLVTPKMKRRISCIRKSDLRKPAEATTMKWSWA